jgi:F-type H+-transporting ATPase subunit delta
MAELATLARPYAEAIFGLADKAGALPQWSRVLAAMAQVVGHPDVKACIENPNLTADQLYGLFVELCSEELGTDAQNFLRVLIANDRLLLLPEIRHQFEALKHEREGVVEADITSAFPLEDSRLAGLVSNLEQRFKRKIDPRVSVDQELIGGVRITVGDEVIDGSVRGMLDVMKSSLLKA